MEGWRGALLVIGLLLVQDVNNHDGAHGNNEVIITRGAVLNPVVGTHVYEEMEGMLFVIPDLPDPPKLASLQCSPNIDKRLCSMFVDSKVVLRDVQDVFKVMNRVLTTKGLSDSPPFTSEKMQTSWVENIPNVDVKSESPPENVRYAVGDDYISQVERRLALRKFMQSGTSTLSSREKRFIGSLALPGMSIAKHLLGPLELSKLFDGLFTGDHGILKAIASLRAASPGKKKAFTDLPSRVSEFEAETKRIFFDVLNRTDKMDKTIFALQNDRDYFAVTVSGKISPVFIPPDLLEKRLKDLESKLDEGQQLVFPASEHHQYYKLKTATCVYDSRGGIMRVGIPTKRKMSAFQLFEYKPIQFAFKDLESKTYTCSLDTPSTYVIKDGFTNQIYPINELDINECNIDSGICRLPMTADQDTASVCISILMQGSSADQIKKNCALQCTERKRSSLIKVSPDVFVGTHLPQKGVSVACPGSNINVSGVDIGSTRITLECTDCRILWDGRLVGESTSIPCSGYLKPRIQTLLPVHFTTLQDLKPDLDDGNERTAFTHMEEIFDEGFQPTKQTEHSKRGLWTTFWEIFSVVQDFLQTVAIIYFSIKSSRKLAVSIEVVQAYVMTVAAVSNPTFKLSEDAYYLLWNLMISVLLILAQGLYHRLQAFFGRQRNERVDLAAAQRMVNINQR
ncbi:unnamed protein product [Orchesella dallaii]|uniref:Uncharacterized protein n=1 Tax=Orchesella dallaii TaxID=48710 RepID=A0ABP1SB19_9HEXA